MKKPISTAKVLTGQHLIGLKKKGPKSSYAGGALFSNKKKKKKKRAPLTFTNGGTAETDPPEGPIKTYEGSDNYKDFQSWQAQSQAFSIYDKENASAQEKYGEGQVISVGKFKADPAFSAFDVPENVTGLKKYKIPTGQQAEQTPGFSGSYYTQNGNYYLPIYDNPGEDKYEVVDSPAQEAKKAENAAYEKENEGIQGWVQETYYDNASGTNKTELVPLPNGQPIPTNKPFRPKQTFANGGTSGNPNKGVRNRAVESAITTVTTDKEVRQFQDDSDEYTVGAKITDGSGFANAGNVNTYAQLRNDVTVDFDGTLEEKEALLRKVNRRNWAGAHGFRGKGWDANMTEEEKAKFKEENKFFEKGRSRHLDYDLTDAGNPTREEYYTKDGVRVGGQPSVSFEDGGKKGPEANSEIEDEEYVKFPDGAVQRGYGEKHKNGGIDLEIPDGTKILSDKRTIDKKTVKMLKEEYGIKTTTKNTFSEVVDKYVKKIGLSKLYDEEEELFEDLDKVLQESYSEGSKEINKEYLSGKIHQIEKQKADKEGLKSKMFDTMFTLQETGKKGEKPKPTEDQPMTSEEFFENGGISREAFNKVTKEYGLTERQGIDMFTGKKSYPNGGTHGEPETTAEAQEMFEAGLITREEADRYEVELAGKEKIKFTTTSGEHKYSDQEEFKREKQKSGEGAYGKITKENLPNVLNELYHQFPDIVAEEYGVTYNEDGTVSFDESIDFSKASDKVKNFQERANKRMNETANLVLKNPESFSPEYVENAQNYIDNETFDESLARGVDSKQGQFTSGRYSLGIDVITPEEQKTLSAKGIFTTKQLQSAVDDGSIELSPGSLERLTNIRKLTPEGADPDFALNTIAPVEAVPELTQEGEPIVETPVEPVIEDEPIIDNIVPPAKQYPKLFASPNEAPLPPSAMEAHLMGNIRLERIDPTRIGVETELQQASDSIKAGTEALAHLPPNQRAAAIVGLQANVQKGINESIHKANIVNAQNQSQAELFNIGQSGREQQARVGNLLSFEQRQMTAKANTDEEVRGYYDQLNRINVNNFRNNQDLNLLNSLAPDYSLNSGASGVDFTPEGEFKLQDNTKTKPLFG